VVGGSETSFLGRAVEAGLINLNFWSYMPSALVNTTATIILGGIDFTQINGSLTYLPVSNNTKSWNTTVASMMLGSTTIWNNTLNTNSSAVFVTGYKYIGLPKSHWDTFCGTIQQMNPTYSVSCFSSINDRPNSLGLCSNFNNNYNLTL